MDYQKHKGILLFLFFLLLADGVFSFIQHFNMPLDGDMSSIILPAEWYSQVLENPFGFMALIEGETYGGANRFFSHWSMSNFFKTIPFAFQKVTYPVNSLYLSCALFKTIVQIGLIFILAMYINAILKKRFLHILMISCLLFPFFQANGFYVQMGIIDQSVTYAFFYAFPLWLTLIWFYPFYKHYFIQNSGKFHYYHWFYLVPLTFVICFSGPLVQPVIFLVCPFTLLYWFVKSWQSSRSIGFNKMKEAINLIPKPLLIAFVGITLMALYSYYIGTYNVENISNNTLTLSDRYMKLMKGIVKILTAKLGFPVLLLVTALNIVILRRYGLFNSSHPLFKMLLALIIFSLFYLLLLPLGGYRSYRPYIVRYDTFMPITILLIGYGVLTSCYVIDMLQKRKILYIIGFIGMLLFFQLSDSLESTLNDCEKLMLHEIANAEKSQIHLSENCRVIGWHSFENPNESRVNAEMLYFWRVTDKRVLYYH